MKRYAKIFCFIFFTAGLNVTIFDLAAAEPIYKAIYAPDIDWWSARDSAIALGGYLATITSAEEQMAATREIGGDGLWWIGAYEGFVEGTWQWVTDEPWEYTNWHPGQPDDTDPYSVASVKDEDDGKWQDGYNWYSYGFILEINPIGPYPYDLILTDSISSWAINTPTPQIHWDYGGVTGLQRRYEIEIGTDQNWAVAEMWDTGPVNSAQSNFLYAGAPLVVGQQYHLRVRVSNTPSGDDNWGSWNLRSFTYFDSTVTNRYGVVAKENMTWQEASDSAKALGGHLVTITSSQESNLVLSLVGGRDIHRSWWIGATDSAVEGNWQWITEEDWDYERFVYRGGDTEDFATFLNFEAGGWSASEGNSPYVDGFIYEPAVPGPYPKKIRISDIVNGDTITSLTPTISWGYGGSNQPQIGYEVEIGTDSNWTTAETWTSGQVLSSDTVALYTGNPFTHLQQYFLRIRVSDGIYWGQWRSLQFRYADLSRLYVYHAISANSITWEKARDSAYAMGGCLATISTLEEQQKIQSRIMNIGGIWWIGATDVMQEGNWEWFNGDPWLYSHWFSGAPTGGIYKNVSAILGVSPQEWATYSENQNGLSGFIVEMTRSSSPGLYCHNLRIITEYGGKYILDSTPQFMWSDKGVGGSQTAYQMQVGSDNNWDTAETWNPGPVFSSDTTLTYAGLPLTHNQPYYFRVRLFDGTKWGVWAYGGFVFHDLKLESFYFLKEHPIIHWDAAQDSAHRLGGYLATITSPEEQQKITNILKADEWWIGATDEGTEGVWRWANGEPWNYTNWFSGEPDGHTVQNHAVTWGNFYGQWRTSPKPGGFDQSYIAGYVVEIPRYGPQLHLLDILDSMVSGTIATSTPTITWEYNNSSGLPQTRYEIQVGTDTNWNVAELWATGQVNAGTNTALYAGSAFQEHSQYYLRARIGDVNAWSPWATLSFTYFDSTQHLYKLVPRMKNWQQAADSAWLVGGYLVTIENGFENNYVQSLFPQTSYHLGGTNWGDGWVWSTGRPFTYTNWHTGEPNNAILGVEDHLYSDNLYAGKWIDDPTNTQKWFVIEWNEATRFPRVFIDQKMRNLNVVSNNPEVSWTWQDGLTLQDSTEIEIGTDASWDVVEMWNPPVMAGNNNTVTYAGAALQDGATYYCRVRTAQNGVWKSWTTSYFRMNTKPIPPVLDSTASVYTVLRPSIWITHPGIDADNDLVRYFFECYYDSLLTIPAVNDSSVWYNSNYTAQWVLSTSLNDNCQVWWRCRVTDGFETSDWSNKASFYIDDAPQTPSLPSLISPLNQTTPPVFNVQPTMQWSVSLDNDPLDSVYYRLEIATDQNFTTTMRFDSIQTTSFTIPDSLTLGTQYWWQVTSYDRPGYSFGPSLPFTFWTWRPGDVNNSHTVSANDLVFLVNYFFRNGPAPNPLFVADINQNCITNLQDLVYLIQHLFNSGPAPKPGCSP